MTVYWITGLSGAGKTTLCHALVKEVRKTAPIIQLDGDELRDMMGATNDYSKNTRLELAMRYAKLCKMLAEQAFNVAIATISLFHEVQDWNRMHIPGYKEIFLDVAVDELKQRNSKNIYAHTNDVTGIHFQAEFPKMPDVHIVWKPQDILQDLVQRCL